MFLVLFLTFSTNSFSQKQKDKENIFTRTTVNSSANQSVKSVNPITDVSTIAIINTSKEFNGLAREVLVKLKKDDKILYHIIDMNAETDQDIFNANKYFILANLGYNVPEIKDKCWGTIQIKGMDYIALFNVIK